MQKINKKLLFLVPLILIMTFTFVKVYATDTRPPTGKVTYSTSSTGVTVTITAREALKAVSGWTLSSDKLTLTKKFTSSQITTGTKEITISDTSGNTSKVEYALDVNLDVDTTKSDLLISAFWGSQVMTMDSNSDKRDKYLNKENGLYASNDGITWEFLGMIRVNNRDAAVMYKDGVFYATATTSSIDTGEIILDIFKSTDLVNWTTEESSAYKIPLNQFENKYADSTGNKTKKTPLYSTHVRDNDTWVSSTILTWGSKWFKDSKGNYYIVLSITDTSVDYRNHNYFTPYIIPIESFGTTTEAKNLEVQNIKLKKPILVNLLDKNGKDTIQTISDYSDRTSDLDYGHIGINLYEQDGIYYLFTKKEQTDYSDGKLQVYYSKAIDGTWTQITDNIGFNDTENPNICIEDGQFALHFEGNYPVKLNNGRVVFLSDHYITSSNSTFNNYDTREGGMYYSTLNTLSSSSVKGSNPKPVSILNTEMWKSSYKSGTKYTDSQNKTWTLKENVLRNATVYKVTNNDARDVIKNFASKNQFSISYSDGIKEISKTVQNNTINISNIATNEFKLDIISNRPLKALSADLKNNGWTLESDEVTITKTFTSNKSEKIAVYDKLGNKTELSITTNISFVTASFTNKDNKNYSWSGKEIKPGVSVTYNGQVLSSDKYTVTYENNINTGKAICNIKSSEFSGIIHKPFYIWPLGPSEVELNLSKENVVKYSWTPSDSDINGYYARIYEDYKESTEEFSKYYDIKAYDSSLKKVSFPKKLEDGINYKIVFYSRKMYGKTADEILTSSSSTRSTIILDPKNYNVDLTLDKNASVEGVPIKLTATPTSMMKDATQYAFLYKKSTDSNWIKARDYDKDSTYDMKISNAGIYDILVKAKVPLKNNGSQTDAIVVTDVKYKIEIISDVTKPTLTAVTNQSDWTNKDLNITITAKDTESGLKSVTVNNNEVKLTNNQVIYTVKSNGSYTIVATDNSGNTQNKVITINKIDKTTPTLEVSTTPSTLTNKNVTLQITAKDTQSGLKSVMVNSTKIELTDGKGSYTITKNGSYATVVTDNAGNITYKTLTINNIDTTPPILSVTQETNGWTNQDVPLVISSSDNESGLKSVTVNGVSLTLENGEALYNVATNGTYTVVATDNANNNTSKTITINQIDKVKPKLTITGSPSNWTNKDVVLTISSSDNESGLKNVTVNGILLTLENGTVKYTVTKNGTYKFISTDKSGNVSTQTVSISKIDKIKPTCNIQKNDKVLSILSQDQNSGLSENAYSWDNITFSKLNSLNITESKKYSAYVKDNAGNISTCSMDVILPKIEPPTISVNSPSSFASKEKSIKIDVIKGTNELNTLNEYEYYLSTSFNSLINGEFIKYESGKAFTIGKEKTGIYYLFVKSIKDIDGEEDTTSSVVTINSKKYYKFGPYIFDNTKPTCEITSASNKWTNQTVTLNVEGKDETSNSDNIFYSFDNENYDYITLTEATTNGTYKAFVKDEVGNVGECSINVSTIEKNKPNITFSLSNSKTYKKSVETILTTSDSESGINASSLKYQWTKSTIQPSISSFKTGFENNQKITKNTGTGNNWYLWVLATDNAGNSSIKKAGPFYLDNDKPTKPSIISDNISGEKSDSDVHLKLNGSNALSGINKYQYSFNNGVSWYDYNEESGIIVKDEGITNVVARSISTVGLDSEMSDVFAVNIERKPLEVEIKKSTDTSTKDNVSVYITSLTKLEQVEGWTLSEDGYVLSKEYQENTNETIKLIDINGSSTLQTININNIDRIPPKIKVDYDNQDLSAMVTITSDEKLQSKKGWTLSSDLKTLKKVYYENTSDNIEILDLAGNKSDAIIDINTIVDTKIEVYLSYQILSGNKIKVTLLSDTKLKPINGWTLSEDKYELTKEYSNDISENIEVSDINGNTQTVQLLYTLPKEEKFEASVNYSKEEKTNEDIIVTIISNMTLKQVDDWILSEDKKSMTKVYTKNTEELLDIISTSDKKLQLKINISNIDKEPPKLIDYKNNGVYNSLKLKFDKPVKSVKITRDGIELDYIIGSDIQYTDPGNYVIEIIDEAGNVSKYNININKDIMNVESPNTSKTVQKIVIIFGIINILVGVILVKNKYIQKN